MIKKVIIGIVVLLTFGGCFDNSVKIAPKGTLTGIVTEADGTPIEGVQVNIGIKSASTGKNGDFNIKDLDVGGNPKYEILFSKKNYLSTSSQAVFTSTLTLEDSGKVDGLPLENSMSSVRVTMTEVVTLKGTLKLPVNSELPADHSIKVVPEIVMDGNYAKYLTKSSYVNSMNNTLEFAIKDVPRVGLNSQGNSIISNLKFKVYVGNNEYADYICDEQNKIILNLESKSKTINKEQNEVAIGDINLNKVYVVTGKIYKSNAAKNSNDVVCGAQVLLKNGANTYKTATSNQNGVYKFTEVDQNNGYSIELKNFDSDGDGRAEYINEKQFDLVMAGGVLLSDARTITRDLWYDGKYGYSITGKVYVGKKELNETYQGIRVVLYNGTNYITETLTDAYGAYKFDKINYKNVTILADDKDLNKNGIADFKGAKIGDTQANSAKMEINNNENSNIVDANLILKINDSEPAYTLSLASTNFTNIKSDGTLISSSNSLNPDDKIILDFNNNLSKDCIDNLEKSGKKLVKVKSTLTGQYIELKYTLENLTGVTETYNRITITPEKYLTENNYTIEVNSELSSEMGYRYRAGNQITDVLSKIPLDTNIELYKLEVSKTNFSNGQTITSAEGFLITFNLPVSEDSKREISSGSAIAFVNNDLKSLPIKTEWADNKTLRITVDSLTLATSYRVVLNSNLTSERGYALKMTMGSTGTTFSTIYKHY